MAKSQRLPIVIMSAIVCCLLVSVAWYTLAYLPAQRQIAAFKQQIADAAGAGTHKPDSTPKKHAGERSPWQQTERGILTVDSNPTGATVTIGDFRKHDPRQVHRHRSRHVHHASFTPTAMRITSRT